MAHATTAFTDLLFIDAVKVCPKTSVLAISVTCIEYAVLIEVKAAASIFNNRFGITSLFFERCTHNIAARAVYKIDIILKNAKQIDLLIDIKRGLCTIQLRS